MELTLTLAVICLLIVLYYIFTRSSLSSSNCKLNRSQRLQPQWILGHVQIDSLFLFSVVEGVAMVTYGKVFHQAIAKLKDKYGDLFCIRVGRSYVYFLSRIDHIEHVLRHRHTYDVSDAVTRNFSLIFPFGLISLKGDRWKRHARIIRPLLKSNKILSHFDTILQNIDRFIDQRFSREDGRIHTDLIIQCQHLLLNIIAQIALSQDFDRLSSNDETNLRQAFDEMIRRANRFALMLGLPLWMAKLILALDFKFQRALRLTKQNVMMIIKNEQMRQQKQQNPIDNKRKTLISSLVDAIGNESSSTNGFLTPEEVSDEISLSIVAAFETTSSALSWFIFFMSKYPTIQQNIKEELKIHHLTSDVQLTEETLHRLIYVECVIKEILRFAPITAGIVRQATCDDLIDGIQVKRGDTFLIAIHNIHQDRRYWNMDPSKFIPERFLHEDQYPPSYAYLPFGAGHRACIGQDLAFMELKMIIVRFMQRISIFDVDQKQENNSGGFSQRITCFPKHMAVRIVNEH